MDPTGEPAAEHPADDPADAATLALSDRWWREVWRFGELDHLHDLLADPFIRHTSTGSETISLANYRNRLAEFQRVLSRVETSIDDRVVAGDRVWTRATTKGINRETGERAVVTWLIVQRMAGGRIAEHWVATLSGVEWK